MMREKIIRFWFGDKSSAFHYAQALAISPSWHPEFVSVRMMWMGKLTVLQVPAPVRIEVL